MISLASPSTSGSFALSMAISRARSSTDRVSGAGPRAPQPMATLPLTPPPGRPMTTPLEPRRGRVPVPCHRLEPRYDLRHRRRVLTVQGPPLEDPLEALGHVQPGPAHRRVQRHDPLLEQPADELGR